MATITVSIRADTGTTQLDVTLLTTVAIADPVAYVQTTTVAAEILARAGLSATLTFVSATLQSSTSIGSSYYYNLLVIYGDTPSNTTTHTHDYSTLTFPLRESYRDGPSIDMDSTLGPLILTHTDDVSTDYLRIRTDTATTARDVFWVKQGAIIRVGAHNEFYPDATYDIGTPDGGTTIRRPRDVRLSRDLYVGQNAAVTGHATFGTYTLGTHRRFTAQAANPDTSSADRHIYVNSVDDSLRYWDGSSETVLSASVGGTDTVGLYTCPAGVSVGEVVYVVSADNVTQANASTLAGNSVAGVVVSKPTATSAAVKYVGEASVFTTLTPGALYYLSRITGEITTDLSTFVTGDTQIVVGLAKNTTTLIVRIGEPFSV